MEQPNCACCETPCSDIQYVVQ